MSKRIALLLDLEIEYSAAIGGWCARSSIAVVESRVEAAPVLDRHELCLVVIGLTGDLETAYERVRTVMKANRGVPTVVLARGMGGELGFRLARLGIYEVIDLPARALDVVARLSVHTSRAQQPTAMAALIGDSAGMQELRQRVREAASVDSKVLLQGETGTGKGLVARLVHQLSSRRAEPFVHVDCAALSPTLIESELFGHEKHSFTGAGNLRRGRFEAAGVGTIFLDEIGDLDAALQSKLLRVLEDRVFERVGGTQSLPMTARVIAATCHDLGRLVAQGRFRPDLYFRLNVIEIPVPPLRERLDDLPGLARAAVDRVSENLGIAPAEIGDSFLAPLRDHHWPGNVRELFNVVERILVRGRSGPLEADELEGLLAAPIALEPAPEPGSELRTAASPPDLTPSERADARRLAEALRATGGNISRASRRLTMPRGTIRHRIHKYGLEHLVQKD
ncbi:MAG: sigma-54-dependent Fis family transcriptional regulator [Deltaproteobacteria bacterium]|nr:sigma-54-dependent Fis family transcriptional regulator [Deltaproteobacteria bacterium]